MPSLARSGAIPPDAEPADPLDSADDDAAEAGEEKLRSGIQSIEVGFRLLDVLTHEPRAMMLRDLAQRAGMSPAKAHRYLVSFLRLGVVAQDPLSGRYELGGFALQLGLARLARVDGVKLARIALAELRDRLDLTVGIAVWGNQGPTVVHWMESSSSGEGIAQARRCHAVARLGHRPAVRGLSAAQQDHAMIERELADSRRSSHNDGPRTPEAVERVLADVRAHGAARVEGMLLPTIHAFCMPVFDSTGDLALGLIALGHEGRSISAGAAISTRRCASVRANFVRTGVQSRAALGCRGAHESLRNIARGPRSNPFAASRVDIA